MKLALLALCFAPPLIHLLMMALREVFVGAFGEYRALVDLSHIAGGVR